MRHWMWRAATLAGLVGVLVAAWNGGWRAVLVRGVTGSPAAIAAAAPAPDPSLPGRAVPILASPHITAAQARTVAYNSVPATSGPHFAFPAATGSYDSPVPEQLTVHTLEHGHIAIQYAPGTDRATVHRLRVIADRYPNDVLLAPYPGLRTGIALTAWGRVETLGTAADPAITRFVEALRNRYAHGWRCGCDTGSACCGR